MTLPSGKLWPLWLFPGLCFVAGSEYLDAITASSRAGRGDDTFGQLVLLWALLAMPTYGVTVLLLRGKLKRLPTRLIALVAVLAAALTAFVFGLYVLVADSRILNNLVHPAPAVLLAPFASPVIGLCAAYILVRQWRRGSAVHAG